MKKIIILFSLLALIGLSACSPANTDAGLSAGETPESLAIPAASDLGSTVSLTDDFSDALSITGQLAVGTLQLEETDLAVQEVQAAELLPLWQALQSLSTSDTAAAAEIDAVVSQIEKTMTPAQIEAIAAMSLTNAKVTELQASGQLTFGGFGGRGVGAQGQGEDGAVAAVPPGELAGGLPGAGMPGGGMGAGPGGGMGGGFGAGQGVPLDEDARATRQAEFENGGAGLQDFAYTNMVIRLLQTRSGQAPANERAALFAELYDVVSQETGLSVEEIQAGLSAGKTLTVIIEESGGDVAAIREATLTALRALPDAADEDIELLVDLWFGD